MAIEKFKNFAQGTLNADISADATSLTLQSGQGDKFPDSGDFRLVIWGQAYSSPEADPDREIVPVTDRSGDTFTISRNPSDEENYKNKAWSAGDKVALVWTSGALKKITDQNLKTTDSPTFAGLTIGSLSGVLKASSGVVSGGATTDDLSEGSSHLYWTQTRFDNAFSAKSTDDLSEGSNNLYWTQARFNSAFSGKTTDDLSEGSTNKYFSGKTQDDLPDGTTYKQYNPANVVITGGTIDGISVSNLLDKSANETIGGNYTFEKEGAATPKIYLNTYWGGSGTYGGEIWFQTADGTKASPTIIGNGGRIALLLFRGYDGSAFQSAGYIQARVDGTPGTDDMPGKIEFYTTPDGSVTPALAFTLDSSQNATFTGKVDATHFGGIASANLLDKSANETITGRWTHNVNYTTSSALSYCGLQLEVHPVIQGDIADYAKGLEVKAYETVDSGYTNNGQLIGGYLYAVRNYLSNEDDSGALSNLFGLVSTFGHYNNNTSASPTTTNAYGLYIDPKAISGTITNLYGIYVKSPTTGGTITNHYAIYTGTGKVRFGDDLDVAKGLTVDTDTLYVDATNHRVGIETTSPGATLHVSRTSLTAPSLTWGADATAIFRGELMELAIGSSNASPYPIYIQGRYSSNTARNIVINPLGGNVGIGTSSFGVDAQKVLAIANGTAPTSSPADMVQLYAEDVSGSSELKVRDEAGNVTTLSPHNFTLFKPKKDYFLPWSYYSKNDYLGREINVDMYGAIKALEELTGKKFIYTREFKPKSWDKEQEKIYQEREKEIKRLKAENERLKKENKKLKEKQPLQEIPKQYKKKPMPEWMKIYFEDKINKNN